MCLTVYLYIRSFYMFMTSFMVHFFRCTFQPEKIPPCRGNTVVGPNNGKLNLRGFRSPSGIVSKPGHNFDFFEKKILGIDRSEHIARKSVLVSLVR